MFVREITEGARDGGSAGKNGNESAHACEGL